MAETVEFASNGGTAPGIWYAAGRVRPRRGGDPGVVGPRPQHQGVADRLGDAGFVALAPDLYHGELAAHTEMDKAAELMNACRPTAPAAT